MNRSHFGASVVKYGRTLILLGAFLALPACDPVSLTLFGVGASAGVSYTLSGIAYKTFTAPVAKVNKATSKALGNMGITVKSKDVAANGEETILAFSADREIEILLEPVSENATRMRTTVKKEGLLYDRATATEIIIQTEKVLVGA